MGDTGTVRNMGWHSRSLCEENKRKQRKENKESESSGGTGKLKNNTYTKFSIDGESWKKITKRQDMKYRK